MQSTAYNFLLNMWIMGRINEDYLAGQAAKNRLTAVERDMIIATPQIKQ